MIEKKKLKDELKFLLWANENQRVMDLRNELHRTNEDASISSSERGRSSS